MSERTSPRRAQRLSAGARRELGRIAGEAAALHGWQYTPATATTEERDSYSR